MDQTTALGAERSHTSPERYQSEPVSALATELGRYAPREDRPLYKSEEQTVLYAADFVLDHTTPVASKILSPLTKTLDGVAAGLEALDAYAKEAQTTTPGEVPGKEFLKATTAKCLTFGTFAAVGGALASGIAAGTGIVAGAPLVLTAGAGTALVGLGALASDAFGITNNATKRIENSIRSVSDPVIDGVTDFFVGKEAQQGYNNVYRGASALVEKSSNFLRESWSSASETASSFWGGVTGSASDAWDSVSGFFSDK